MKIALINENSQAAKNEMIYKALKNARNKRRCGTFSEVRPVSNADLKRLVSFGYDLYNIAVILSYICFYLVRCRGDHYLAALMVGVVSEHFDSSRSDV